MAKFAKYLSSHCVGEWSNKYVQYKALKKLIKQIKESQQQQQRSQDGHQSELDTTHNYDHLLQSLVDPLVTLSSTSSTFVVAREATTSPHPSPEVELSSIINRD